MYRNSYSRYCTCITFLFFVLFDVKIQCMNNNQDNRLSNRRTIEDYLNVCMQGKYHKHKPSSEVSLFAHCSPWRKRSCCTEDTTKQLHKTNTWYNLNWDHCGKMSDMCRGHFLQDLCFYECSPNVGPWLVKVNMKTRKERFYKVPLCRRECERWWNDCKDDFTCIRNWSVGFNWTTGTTTCPTGTSCQKFEHVFHNAIDFCESVWDNSWKVVSDKEPCMVLWFHGNKDNPNDAVSKQTAFQYVNNSVVNALNVFLYIPSLMVLCYLGINLRLIL